MIIARDVLKHSKSHETRNSQIPGSMAASKETCRTGSKKKTGFSGNEKMKEAGVENFITA